MSVMPGKKVQETKQVKTPEERILSAAAEEFAAKGFFGARTQTIADAGGVNKAMLHYYFRSKENLYTEVIKTAFGKILREVSQAWLSPDDLENRLEVVIDSYLENYRKNPAFLKIVLREVVDGGKRFRRAFKGVENSMALVHGSQGCSTRGRSSTPASTPGSPVRSSPRTTRSCAASEPSSRR